MKKLLACLLLSTAMLAQSHGGAVTPEFRPAPGDGLRDVREPYFTGVRQITKGDQMDAEAYWSFDGKKIIFQSTRNAYGCDQQFIMNADGTGLQRVSPGKGRVTCGYFLPGDRRLIYASTHDAGASCPDEPPRVKGSYRWTVFDSFDLYTANADGSDLKPFLSAPGYDAEATLSPNGKWIIFTSERSGDLDLWRVDVDGRNLKQITHRLGYDGGAFFSPDSSMLVWRCKYPSTPEDIQKYKTLLAQHQVEPMEMDLWVSKADGTEARQVTRLPGASFAPTFTPDGKSLVFASNWHDQGGRGFNFQLYRINLDGSGLVQLTHGGAFNSFPHFSPDGTTLMWISNRQSEPGKRQFHVYQAAWKG